MTKFSKTLTSLREKKGYSLETLTSELNKKSPENIKFSRASLNRWEKGETSPSLDHAKVLAKFFGVTLDQLGGFEEITYMPEVEAIAAHIDDDVTEEELEEILAYIEMKRSLRRNRNK